MSTNIATHVPRMPRIDPDAVEDQGLRDILDHAAVTKSPPIAWYATMGQNPEVAVAFAASSRTRSRSSGASRSPR
jgi:hypothetical protein